MKYYAILALLATCNSFAQSQDDIKRLIQDSKTKQEIQNDSLRRAGEKQDRTTEKLINRNSPYKANEEKDSAQCWKGSDGTTACK